MSSMSSPESILSAADPVYESPLPLNVVYGAENKYYEGSTNLIGEAQEPLEGVNEYNYLQEQPDGTTLCTLHSVDESNYLQGQPDGTTLFNLPVQSNMDTVLVKREYIGEPSYINASSNAENLADVDYMLNEPLLEAMNNPQYVDGSFTETSELKPSVEGDPQICDFRLAKWLLEHWTHHTVSTFEGTLGFTGGENGNI